MIREHLKYLFLPLGLLGLGVLIFTGCQNSGGGFAANEEALYLFDDGTSDIPQRSDTYDYGAGSSENIAFTEEETVSYAAASSPASNQYASNDTQYYSPDPAPSQPQVRRASVSSSTSYSSGSGTSTYTVRSGDSLYKIARAHGMSVDRLKSLNGISGSMIHPGDRLKVSGSAAPGTRTASASSSRSSGGSYTVRSGDTLWGISRRHGVSVTSIKNANGLSGNTIQPGQRLTIP
jgi:LysM repeat protein